MLPHNIEIVLWPQITVTSHHRVYYCCFVLIVFLFLILCCPFWLFSWFHDSCLWMGYAVVAWLVQHNPQHSVATCMQIHFMADRGSFPWKCPTWLPQLYYYNSPNLFAGRIHKVRSNCGKFCSVWFSTFGSSVDVWCFLQCSGTVVWLTRRASGL